MQSIGLNTTLNFTSTFYADLIQTESSFIYFEEFRLTNAGTEYITMNLTNRNMTGIPPYISASSSTSKTITSQLSQAITATVVVNVDGCPIDGTYQGSPVSSDSCNGSQATFLLTIPSGASTLILGDVANVTDGLIDQLALTPALIGLVLLALFFGIAIKALIDFRNAGSIDWRQLLIQVIIVGFIGVVLLLFSVVYQTLGNIGG